MDVSEVMTTAIVTVRPRDTVRLAMRTLEEQEIRHLPVLDDDGQLIGMISDRDLRDYRMPFFSKLEGTAQAGEMLDVSVSRVMASQVLSVDLTDSVKAVIDMMLEYKVGAVPVLDRRTDDLVGIVSYVDVLRGLREIA